MISLFLSLVGQVCKLFNEISKSETFLKKLFSKILPKIKPLAIVSIPKQIKIIFKSGIFAHLSFIDVQEKSDRKKLKTLKSEWDEHKEAENISSPFGDGGRISTSYRSSARMLDVNAEIVALAGSEFVTAGKISAKSRLGHLSQERKEIEKPITEQIEYEKLIEKKSHAT